MADYPESASLSISDHVLACELEHELAILNQTTGIYYTLDDVGKFIWRKMEGRITFGALKDALADTYDCDPDTAASDVETLIRDLRMANLIELNIDAGG